MVVVSSPPFFIPYLGFLKGSDSKQERFDLATLLLGFVNAHQVIEEGADVNVNHFTHVT